MYIYLLIQTLQYEEKHIIHESLMQTFNPPVNYVFALNDYDAITNVIPVSYLKLAWSHSILAVFFLYSMDIRPGIFLLHIYGSVDYWFHFICITCSVYSIIITLIEEKRAGLYDVVYQWVCTLKCSDFCVCPFGSMPKAICYSWCLNFIIIMVVL